MGAFANRHTTLKFSLLYQNQLRGQRKRFIHVHVAIIGPVPEMDYGFLVQITSALVYSFTMVNVVGVATSTKNGTDVTFDFGTLHQPMLTNTLVAMTNIRLPTLHLLPISLVSSA